MDIILGVTTDFLYVAVADASPILDTIPLGPGSDAVYMAEVTYVGVSPLPSSFPGETIILSESVSVSMFGDISVEDTIVIDDSTVIVPPPGTFLISVLDSIPPVDVLLLPTPDLEIGEVTNAGGALDIEMVDNVPISDVIPSFTDTIYLVESVYVALFIQQFGDDVTITESVSVTMGGLAINVDDQITLVDVVVVGTPEAILEIDVFDQITITEDVVVFYEFLSVDVYDNEAISDGVEMFPLFMVSVFDTVTITDVVTSITSIRYSPSSRVDHPFGDDGGLI